MLVFDDPTKKVVEKARGLKREGNKRDNFPTPELMAVKKAARNMCEAQIFMGTDKGKAAESIVLEVHRRWPGFIRAWEEENGEPWPGDKWFAKRVNHQSLEQENKLSHLRVALIAEAAAASSNVYSWDDWKKLVYKLWDPEAKLVEYVYLLPFRRIENSSLYDIQKPGIGRVLAHRLTEHNSRGPRGLYYRVPMWPARDFVLTCCLGEVTLIQAQAVENDCKAAIGAGKRAWRGNEWFEASVLGALASMLGVLKARGLNPESNEPLLKELLGAK